MKPSLFESPKDSTRVAVQTTPKSTKRKQIKYYKVRSGDTLSEIAEKHNGLTVAKLKKLNKMRSQVILRPGMRLRIS
jgi:membrane-bound lytic murein transglycosylase D